MPDDGYEYLLGMKDEMSGPARRVSSELEHVQKSLKSTDDALKSHARAHEAASRAAGEHASKLSDVARGFAASTLGIGSRLSRDIAEGELLAHAFEKLGDIIHESVTFAIEASEFKENVTQAYEVTLGSADQAQRAFSALDHVARDIHMPAEKAHEIASKLMLEGVQSMTAITQTVEAIGDLQRAGLGQGADKLQSIIDRSVSAGHLEFRGARALAGTGVTMDAIANELGIGRQKFEAELKAGRITVEDGIGAIDRAILHGKVGELATKRFTITDAFVDLKNSIRGVFQETDTGPLMDAVKRVSDQFKEGSEGAQMMKEAVDLIVEGIAKVVDTAADIGDAFTKAGDKVYEAWHGVLGFITRHDPLMSDVDKTRIMTNLEREEKQRALGKAVKKQDEGLAAVQAASMAGKSEAELHKIGEKYGLQIETGKGIDRYFQHQVDVLDAQRKALAESGIPDPDTFTPGRKPVSIEREHPGLHELGKDAGAALHEGAKEGLDAHSPSRKMHDLGFDAADSFQSGASAGNDVIERAAKSTESPSRAVDVTVHVGGIQLHGAIGADDFLPLLESGIADIFERAAMELGQ